MNNILINKKNMQPNNKGNILKKPRVKRLAVPRNSNHKQRVVSFQQRPMIPEINIARHEPQTNVAINSNIQNNKYYSLKEIIKLGIDVANTKKVFINGESRYVVDSNSFAKSQTNIEDSNILNESNTSSIDDMFVNEEASDVNDAHYDYESENNIEFNQEVETEQNTSNNVGNLEFINKQTQEENQNINQSNELNVYDDEFSHSEEELSDENSVYDVQELSYDDDSDEFFENVDYVKEYYDDTFQDTFEQIEYDKKIDYEEKIRPLQIVKNWNKKLWRPEDVLYKIYNISFNQNHDDPNAGCLYNFSFDIYPGDRIAILSHDSMSDLLLLDILKNDVEKDSGYVFFNLKREQKWFDIYSSEFDGFDVEMFNRRYEAIYQLQSPDYLSYGKNKNDTVDSTFKKIFNTIKQVINERLFGDLLYLLDFEKELDTLISNLDDLKKRKFIFICDVLIGKKIIIMSNLTEGFDITQKISFYRYINALYQDSDTVILFNVKDSFEVKLLANRLIIIDDGEPVVNKKIKDILNTFETLDTFIVEAFDKLHKKYL